MGAKSTYTFAALNMCAMGTGRSNCSLTQNQAHNGISIYRFAPSVGHSLPADQPALVVIFFSVSSSDLLSQPHLEASPQHLEITIKIGEDFKYRKCGTPKPFKSLIDSCFFQIFSTMFLDC